jgi:lysine-ketoglutarate reductase/saccharopine dehydrogenase-like protein (TIGR00300 family)
MDISFLAKYAPPDFNKDYLKNAPLVKTEPAPDDGIAPHNYHATSNHPEYLHIKKDKWILIEESRMDTVIKLIEEKANVVEFRRIKKGDPIIVGRTENGEEGIYVHTTGFESYGTHSYDKFSFRTRGTRETPFSYSYDELYKILEYDRKNGFIVWVLGPAVAFDKDSRDAMQYLIEKGFCHALIAGNALATHDLEAAYFHTGLGQDIYTQTLQPLGHYNHLDIINIVRKVGSISSVFKNLDIKDGIIYACEKCNIPYVLAGSIRDDGPLPSVIANVYEAQDRMRQYAKKATIVIAMATQLHSIAFGNMLPSYRVLEDGTVRKVLLYVVDISEFSADKLANRGSAQAIAIVTNVQDFIVNLKHNLV